MNLDLELVAAAREVLGTNEMTETVHRALAQVVRQARLQRLAERRFDISDADLAELRRSRTADAPAVSIGRRS